MKIKQLILIAMLAFAAPLWAQTAPKVKSLDPAPKTILYVGNSFFYFNDSMHRLVGGLIAQGDPQNRAQYRQTSVTISGDKPALGSSSINNRGDVIKARAIASI